MRLRKFTKQALRAAPLGATALGACAGADGVESVSQLDGLAQTESAAPEPVEAKLITLCKSDEITTFSGSVDDDFGLDVSACVKPGTASQDPTISIRISGEGGGRVISCVASQCDGTIGLQHYRRPRFTTLTLEWTSEGSRQKLVESFYAGDMIAEPKVWVTHEWTTPDMLAQGVAAPAYPVKAFTEPLALLKLGRYLPAKDWPERALPPIK